MGQFWLHDLPAACRDAGLDIELYPGWETLSRSSGGLDNIWAVFVHHTAGGPNQNTDAAAYNHYRTHQFKPCGNITLGREGRIILGAAGAANTQGVGGPIAVSKGIIPKDKGNTHGIAIEACNNGIGEFWPQVQLNAYVKLCAVICDLYGLDPLRDVIAHFEWTTRKIDPAGGAGQYPYAKLNDTYLRWNMDKFRQDVNSVDLGDTMKTLATPRRVLDTREGIGMMPARQWREHSLGNVGNEAAIQITYISDGTAGHAYISPAGTAGTVAHIGGDAADKVEYGPVLPVKTPGGRIRVTAGPGNFHYVIDVYASETGQ